MSKATGTYANISTCMTKINMLNTGDINHKQTTILLNKIYIIKPFKVLCLIKTLKIKIPSQNIGN